MPLENFYDRSDKAARRALPFTALAVLLLAGAGYLFFSNLDDAVDQAPPLEEIAEDFRKLPDSHRAQRVDALCSSFPKPERFRLVSKDFAPPVDGAKRVVYRYETERDFSEIMTFFTVWFSSHGWKSDAGGKNAFSKDGQKVTIESRDDFRNSYEIHCSESEKDGAVTFTDKDI